MGLLGYAMLGFFGLELEVGTLLPGAVQDGHGEVEGLWGSGAHSKPQSEHRCGETRGAPSPLLVAAWLLASCEPKVPLGVVALAKTVFLFDSLHFWHHAAVLASSQSSQVSYPIFQSFGLKCFDP